MLNKGPWPTNVQGGMMPPNMMQGMPMQGMPMQGMPMQGMPMQGMPIQGMTMQGMTPPPVTNGVPITPSGTTLPNLPTQEESYVENILRMNIGKVGTFYMTFENNSEWNAKIFKGVVEASGRDHIIISDPVTGKRYLLLMLNLDYVTFDEPINYSLPFGSNPSR
jgi:spore germination protein Q